MIEAEDVPETAKACDLSEEVTATPAQLSSEADDQFKSLGAKALKGTAWSVGAYGSAMAFRLLSNILLSRLLVPQYFGLMALLNSTITGLTLFSDFGLAPNIILSKRGDDPAFLNTAWTMQVIRGVGLWIFCLCLSFPFAKFYGEPSLSVLVPVIAFSLVISGFNSTSLATLERHLEVRKLALIELSIQVSQLVFTIVWALIHRSIWALVAGKLFSDVVRLVVSKYLIPGYRNSFQWESPAVRELFGYARWVIPATSLFFLSSQSDRMVLGKLVSFRTLGLYGIAFALSDVPRQIILTFSQKIVVPFVSKVSHLPRPEFLAVVLKYRRGVLMSAASFLAIVVATGDVFLSHIYDARYHDATWIVPILAVGLWHTILYNTTTPCLYAVNKRHYAVTGYFLSALVVITITPITFHKWGMLGAVWTVALSDVPMYFVNLCGMMREGMPPFAQDLKATLFFFLLLGALILIRTAVGIPFPHSVALQ